ncbi:MAG: hypothetical protein TREMPRED_000188, partial [Tremellales sp. Tagirdzhanova-0007]
IVEQVAIVGRWDLRLDGNCTIRYVGPYGSDLSRQRHRGYPGSFSTIRDNRWEVCRERHRSGQIWFR